MADRVKKGGTMLMRHCIASCNRGVCALQDFVYQIGNPSVTTVKTNGLYYEPGEKSYMRETIAYQVLG